MAKKGIIRVVIGIIAAAALLAPADNIPAIARSLRGEMGDRVVQAARQFEGRPYIAKTLEVSDTEERCVARLDGFDCVTLVESAVALARLSYQAKPTDQAYRSELIRLRYRGGRLDGYLSRLHYTSEWLRDNSQRGVIVEITPSLPGAAPLVLRLNYMSSHPSQYRQLKANPAWVRKMREIEVGLNNQSWRYIPKADFAQVESLIKTGDIIAFTTKAAGLDTSHLGLAWRDEKGELRLLHASTLSKRVTLDGPVRGYLSRQSSVTGVMLGRPASPLQSASD